MDYPDDPTMDDNRSGSTGRIEMDQDEVDAIIRNKRKVRDPKACYACHRRKVKCDRNLPCDSCVKRDHPELCSYERPTKKKRLALNQNISHQSDGARSVTPDCSPHAGSNNITIPKERWERINTELQQLKAAVHEARASVADVQSKSDSTDREGVYAPSTQMGTMHLGSRSILAYMMGNKSKASQDAAKVLLEENILPKLGLDNETATYPFIDLWSTESSIQDVSGLCGALPEDNLCQEFWTAYRDVPCTIYPVVPDTDAFESTLTFFLRQRAESCRDRVEIDANKPYGVSMPWLALLFAVLASGAQSTSRTAKERELTSQVYICCSYQALRMANFLSHGCLETIQACLIIGNALAYNMNPGVAYIVLGMTLRSALSMGLHVNSQKFSEHENYLRGRIWWALAWQDSHFSVSYDRPSSSILCFPEIPYTKHSGPGQRSYVESMSAMIRFTQQILRDRTLNPKAAMSWSAIQHYKEEVSRIIADTLPRLRERSLCTTISHHLERLAFKLHSAYMMSEICRPALKEPTGASTLSPTPAVSPSHDKRPTAMSSRLALSPNPGTAESAFTAQLRADCIINLERSIEAFVELHEYSIYAARSWIGIQRSISAAFLLGILRETRQEPRIVKLLDKLQSCLATRALEDIGFDLKHEDEVHSSPVLTSSAKRSVVNNSGTRPGMSESPNWAKSMTKSLHALGQLNAALSSQKGATFSPSAIGQNLGPDSARYTTPNESPIGASSHVGSLGQAPTSSHGTANQYPPSSAASHNHLQQRTHHAHHSGVGSTMALSDSYSPASQSSYLLSGAKIPRPSSGPQLGSTIGLGPVTPDSGSVCSGVSGSNEWNTMNITERALEYVTPGLWG